jgi:uncharacterized protein (TIGR00255 family)
MTGYGKAEKTAGNIKISVEVRSLNSKQLDITLKSAQLYRSLEMDMRKLISTVVARGKVDINVTRETLNEDINTAFNPDVFKSYFNAISKTVEELGLHADRQDFVSSILRLPEVVLSRNEELTETEIETALECCTEALNAMDLFRAKEGKTLISDIFDRISIIEYKLKSLEIYETSRIEKIKTSIENALNQLVLHSEIDKNRFEQELIYYIEKIDITEEKVRLAQHCHFFKQTGNSEEMPGRKLGFIAQEIGREINTIGSKACDADIQKIVVEMKDELEKIKEQLLNIL